MIDSAIGFRLYIGNHFLLQVTLIDLSDGFIESGIQYLHNMQEIFTIINKILGSANTANRNILVFIYCRVSDEMSSTRGNKMSPYLGNGYEIPAPPCTVLAICNSIIPTPIKR